MFAHYVFVDLDSTQPQARLLRLQGRLQQAIATYEQMAQM
jgi:hypothetical protein